MKQKQSVWAADFGGTKLLIGEVDETGKILRERRFSTGYLTQSQAMVRLAESLTAYREQETFASPPQALGIGLVGQIDAERGVWIKIDSRRYEPVQVQSTFSKQFGLPCRVDNDVKAATLAEQRFGAGRDVRDFIYVNFGTGIAAGIVSDGRLVRGMKNNAGEVGHMVVDAGSGVACHCGRFGCAEALASGSGMDRRVRTLLPRYPCSSLRNAAEQPFIRAESIFAAARQGDALANRITMAAAEAAAELILNLVRVSSPQRVILGGGVASDTFFRGLLEQRLRMPLMEDVLVMPSPLDPARAGLLGAAAVALQEKE